MTSKPSPRSSVSPSELNRALRARQWLLDRVEVSVPDAVEHLVGLQAQATLPPYYGLAARLRGFTHADLSAPLEAGDLVRMTLMRGTVHLVTPRDAAFEVEAEARSTAAFAGARDVRFEPALPSPA